MTNFAAKMENDPVARARALSVLNKVMGVTCAAAVVTLGLLALAVFQ